MYVKEAIDILPVYATISSHLASSLNDHVNYILKAIYHT